MKRMAIASLLVCAGLVLAWWLLQGKERRETPAELPAWVRGLGEPGTSLLEVRAGGRVMRFEQTAPGTWLWRGEDGASWPARPERVRGALRLLSEAAPTGSGFGAGPPLDGAAEVLVTIDGVVRRLRVGTQALGGLTPMELGDESGRMVGAHGQAGLAALFEPTSLLAWREDRALASGQTEPSALRIRAGEGSLSLVRARGRWAVSSPVMAEAEAEIVQRALAGLMDVRIVRFVPREDAEPGVTDSPSVVLELESESRRLEGGEVVSRTLAQELRLGAPIGGTTHLARAEAWWMDPESGARTAAWGPMYAAVSAGAVPIPTRAEAVISRIAWSLAPSDVRELWVCEPGAGDEPVPAVAFARGIEGWSRAGGKSSLAGDAAGAGALATLLSEARAERVELDSPPGVSWMATVHAAVGGKSARRAEIGVVEAGGPRVVVRSGGVCRVYAAGAAGEVPEWLRSVLAGGR